MFPLLKTLPVIGLVLLGIGISSHATPLPIAAEGHLDVNSFTKDWQSIVGTMSVTGVLVWYLWYTTSAAFPKIRQDFRDEMSTERQYHSTAIDRTLSRMDQLCTSIDGLTREFNSTSLGCRETRKAMQAVADRSHNDADRSHADADRAHKATKG